jgi:hypothetical protein
MEEVAEEIFLVRVKRVLMENLEVSLTKRKAARNGVPIEKGTALDSNDKRRSVICRS